MHPLLIKTLSYALIPCSAVVLGGGMALLRPPKAIARSYIQHFAAGVVFAAVSVELLPDIMRQHGGHAAMLAILGFLLGVVTMLGMKWLTEKLLPREKGGNLPPFSLIVTVGLDVFIDGLIVGIGFAIGSKEGILLTLALALEIFFLGLSVVTALRRSGGKSEQALLVTVALAGLFALGSALGAAVLGGVSDSTKEVLLAFGAVALLYLVTEELLVEAHEESDPPLATATFFGGFLIILVLQMVNPM